MLKGKGVSNGIGIGSVVVLKKEERVIEKKTVKNAEKSEKNKNCEFLFVFFNFHDVLCIILKYFRKMSGLMQ